MERDSLDGSIRTNVLELGGWAGDKSCHRIFSCNSTVMHDFTLRSMVSKISTKYYNYQLEY